ncbi:superoxide dismutase copper/zinc binding protein [Segniliparus rotundus DSM 44985]|uniref:Superoxide dismutase copper/zinc binding protein n=1 Tax=Segniliparus rotundus (strain ATCC BAA-972 / CDC 1076 / CIP 108378 / DSM 44985 / JCM 13578) TaxID=640132 RepID=D6ZE23_SEGRD|nr:superoxide dismutase family protein [Segniliparus rotundus]ADG97303.1 superoxide dismutase copper/zinc binding protein [Segniliparus rotundus DSM 44985]
MSHVDSKRKASHGDSTGVVRAALAFAALAALAGCTNSEQDSVVGGPGATPKSGAAHPGHVGASAEPGASSAAKGNGGSEHASAELKNAQGADAGTVDFTQNGGKVVIKIDVKGLTPGFHAVHIHAVGKCEPQSTAPGGQGAPGAFLSAGGHYQAPGHTGMPMSGDLTNLLVMKDGTGKLTLETDAFQLSQLDSGAGTSIIVHDKASNFGNIPADRYKSAQEGGPVPDETTMKTEDAGGRAVCGVIAPTA